MHTRNAIIETPLGELTLVASDDAIVGLYFPQHWYLPPAASIGPQDRRARRRGPRRRTNPAAGISRGDRTSFELPIATDGNPFQERVWAMLREIPFGETTTYGELAEKLGDKALAQTVGRRSGTTRSASSSRVTVSSAARASSPVMPAVWNASSSSSNWRNPRSPRPTGPCSDRAAGTSHGDALDPLSESPVDHRSGARMLPGNASAARGSAASHASV